MASIVKLFLAGPPLLFVGAAALLVAGPVVVTEYQMLEATQPHDVTIVSSEVETATDFEDNREVEEYYVEVTYEYTVDGQTYRNDRLAPLGLGEFSRERAREFVRRYPEGETVTGYVDLDDPERSFLVKRTSGPFFKAFLGFGVLALLVGMGATAWFVGTVFGIGPFGSD